jgi:hypothetical protein
MNSKNQKIFNLKSKINKIRFKNKPAIMILKKTNSSKIFMHFNNKWTIKIELAINILELMKILILFQENTINKKIIKDLLFKKMNILPLIIN